MRNRLTARSSATLAGAANDTSSLSAIAVIQRAGMARMISPGRRLTDPVQVRVAASDNWHHDELRHLVVVQLVHARAQRRDTGHRRLHDELPLVLALDLPLPSIGGFHLRQYVHARR